ncbi:unnamed protein product, partial [Owenia fusiformis]
NDLNFDPTDPNTKANEDAYYGHLHSVHDEVNSTPAQDTLKPHHEYHPDDVYPGVDDPNYDPNNPESQIKEDEYYGHPLKDHLKDVTPTDEPFTDIPGNKPHHEYHPNDIFPGVNDPKYDPNNSIAKKMEDAYYSHPVENHLKELSTTYMPPTTQNMISTPIKPHHEYHPDDRFPGVDDPRYDPSDPFIKNAEDAYYGHPLE